MAKLAANAPIPGPAGPPGPPGPQGPPGGAASLADGAVTTAKLAANAVTGPKVATSLAATTINIANGTTGSASPTCPAGGKAVGGGAAWLGGISDAQAQNLHIVQSYPAPPSTWVVRGYNNTGSARSFSVWALCVTGG